MKNLLLALTLSLSMFSIASADKATAPADKKAPADVKKVDSKAAPDKPAAKSLFDRLGGKDAITKVVDEFVANVAADKVINKRFAKTDIAKLKTNLVDQVCAATGGPCKYAGKNMKEAHAGMKITEAEWTATVGDLQKALAKFKVGDAEQKELLGALGGMHDDIVEAKPAAAATKTPTKK